MLMRVHALMLGTHIPEFVVMDPRFRGDDRSQATYSAKVASQAVPHSPSRRALRIDVERIERVARAMNSRLRLTPPKQRLSQRTPSGVPSCSAVRKARPLASLSSLTS